MHKLRIDAVHNKISKVAQILQVTIPKGQLCACNKSSNASGIINNPTSKSAVANEVSNKLVNVRILLYKQTERTTNILPSTVAKIKII